MGPQIMKAPGKKLPALIMIHFIGLLFLAAGISLNPLKITRAFFSDESVYYTMAYSFAYDNDMAFQQRDLVRVYREFAAGPQGIVLKLNERDENIVFGKAYLYSLVASPFVRFFGTNGFFIFHALLFWLNLLCGYRYCRSIMQPRTAVLFSCFYFLMNASVVYLFWMTPEYFNMSLICFGFFFLIAAERLQSSSRFFSAPYNYCIAAVFFGLATFSKPTNALLVIPAGIWLLAQRKILTAAFTLSIFVLTTILLFAVNIYLTGEWNYQGGRRSIFYDHFPYDRAGASPFGPFKKKRIVEVKPQDFRPPFYWKSFGYNWGYFFFGRFSGLAIYFFPMFFALIYYLVSKKARFSLVVYSAGWIGVLTYMVGIPWNYFGGSGTIGNRYLMNAFPIFLFAIGREPSKRTMLIACGASLMFTSAFLFTPVISSFDNSFHQKQSLFRKLPLERTLLSDLPINTNLRARRVAFDDPATYFLYFMDDNTYYKEAFEHQYGFWVQGEREAEIVMRTWQPVSRLSVRVKSLQPGNRISIQVNGNRKEILSRESVFYEGELRMPAPLPYDRDGTGATYLYDIKIQSSSGIISRIETGEERYLGAFVHFELPESKGQEVPEEAPSE
jgi:hypothetical protein